MFLVFAGKYNYPLGGWDDFVGSQASLDGARSVLQDVTENGGMIDGQIQFPDWGHVTNLQTGKKVLTWHVGGQGIMEFKEPSDSSGREEFNQPVDLKLVDHVVTPAGETGFHSPGARLVNSTGPASDVFRRPGETFPGSGSGHRGSL